MSRPINILHLTDFHYSKRKEHDQRIVIDALLADIAKLSDGTLKPDLIVFSGDLVDNADEESIYDLFFDSLLEPLSKVARCGESRIVISAGNHDAHRSFVQKDKHRLDGLAINLTDRTNLNNEYSSGALANMVGEKFKGFLDLRSYIGEHAVVFKNAVSSVYGFPDLNLSVVELNSAWMGYTGLDKIRDERKLLIPEAAIYDALRHVPEAHAAMLVTHHPSNWLAEFCESDFLNAMDGKFRLALFGHMHESRPQQVGTFKGTCLFNQGGALYSSRDDWYIGYSLLRLDPVSGHIEAHFRTYFDRRREFDSAVDIVDSGRFFSSDDAKAFFYKQARIIDRPSVRAWCHETALPTAEKAFNEGLTDRKVCDLFVPPPLYMKSNYMEREGQDVAEQAEVSISFDDLVFSASSCLIAGNAEYGKTTLLQQIALKLFREPQSAEHFTVPVVISFGQIKRGENRIEALIREALPDLPDGCTVQGLLNEGLVTVLCDDVFQADGVRYPLLRQFVTKYSNNRYIFSVPAGRNDRYLTSVDTELPIRFEVVSIHSLRRRDMRTLVKKWDTDHRLDQDVVLDRVVNEIKSMNVPLTAVNGTILLSIMEDQPDFTPINRTVLIEQFIEVLLEKRGVEQIDRRSFDFRNYMHYLAHVAGHMAENDRYVLDMGALHQISGSYLDSLGFTHKAEDLIAHCLECRIFVRKGSGDISFRYRAFLEFFIAKQMKESDPFRTWVLDDARYLGFVNELQYYAGIGRNDEALLEMIGERFEALTNDFFKERPDQRIVENFKLGNFESSDDLLDAVGAQLSAPPLTASERDEILEADIPQDVEGRQEVFRPKPADPATRFFTCLVIYSNILRNSELVPDQMKRLHLSQVLNGWGNLFTASLIALPLLVKHRRMRLNGVEYVVAVPKHFSDGAVARIIFLDFPNVISKLVWATVGTQKLERQLTEPKLVEASEPKLITFFRQALCVDLRVGDWQSRFETFTEGLRDNRYLLEGALWKANEAFTIGVMQEAVRMKLAKTMSKIIAALQHLPKSERGKLVSDRMSFYRRQDLIRRLKTGNDEE